MSRLHSTYRWQQKAKRQLAHEPLCRMCRDLFGRVRAASIADHIERHDNDPERFWDGALQSVCKECHDSLKQQQERSGEMAGHCRHGWPVDPGHPWNKQGGCPDCGKRGGT